MCKFTAQRLAGDSSPPAGPVQVLYAGDRLTVHHARCQLLHAQSGSDVRRRPRRTRRGAVRGARVRGPARAVVAGCGGSKGGLGGLEPPLLPGNPWIPPQPPSNFWTPWMKLGGWSRLEVEEDQSSRSGPANQEIPPASSFQPV